MNGFEYPWLLLLAALPFAARLLPARSVPGTAVVVPFVARIEALLGARGRAIGGGAQRVQRAVCWTVWLLLVTALARPSYYLPPIEKAVATRDLLLAVDLSGSMETKDFHAADGATVDRLTAVKQVLDDFLARRKGDRVALVFFGSAPFVQAGFTEDLGTLRELLAEARVRMAGPKTALGDALGLSIGLFDKNDAIQDRVVILLTDGNDTASLVPPARAAEIAKDRKIVVHTVAVGDPQAAGEEKLDEATLQQVAKTTGGRFAKAEDAKALEAVYAELDRLRAREATTIVRRPREERFWWPLGAALAVAMGALGGAMLIGPRRPGVRAAAVHVAATVAVAPLLLAAAPADGVFVFLRPAWLLVLAPALVLPAAYRRLQDPARAWRGVADAELLDALVAGRERRGARRGPTLLLTAAFAIGALALAGPSFGLEAAETGGDDAALVAVVEVSPTMLAQDVAPTRLARGAAELQDVLGKRAGMRCALVAYAGSAHLAMPLTTDAHLIADTMAALAPDVMPDEGDAAAQALALAVEQVRKSELPGSILWITDGTATPFPPRPEVPMQILAVGALPGAPAPADGPPAPALDRQALDQLARKVGGDLVLVTADDADVDTLVRGLRTARVAAKAGEPGARPADAGYWVQWLVAALALLTFRRGWRPA